MFPTTHFFPKECSSSYFPKEIVSEGFLLRNSSNILSDKELNDSLPIVEAEVYQITDLAPSKKRKEEIVKFLSQKKQKKEPRLDKTALISLLPINSNSKQLSIEKLQTILNAFKHRVGEKREDYGEYLRNIVGHIRKKNSLDEKIIEIGSILLKNIKQIKSFVRHSESDGKLFLLYKSATKFFYFLSILNENKIDKDQYMKAATALTRHVAETSFNNIQQSSLYKWKAMINLAKGCNVYAGRNIQTAIKLNPGNEKLLGLQQAAKR